MTTHTHLSAAGLVKGYRKGKTTVPVLHGTDVEVDRGEFVAVIGASGSGKSTLLASLVGTYGDRPPGSLVALEGSSGLVEVAEVNGNAGIRLDAGPGTTVTFRREFPQ